MPQAPAAIETQPPYSDMLRRLQRALSSPGPPGTREEWDNFINRKYEDEFVDEFSLKWIEPLFYLCARPAIIQEAIVHSFINEDSWEADIGSLLGRVARKFPVQMLPSICQMLHIVETRLIAICALNWYGGPDALPCFESILVQTGQMKEGDITDLIEGIESVIFRSAEVRPEAERILRSMRRFVPPGFAEACKSVYGNYVKRYDCAAFPSAGRLALASQTGRSRPGQREYRISVHTLSDWTGTRRKQRNESSDRVFASRS